LAVVALVLQVERLVTTKLLGVAVVVADLHA
jgi:hypothetical protein